MHEHKFQIGQLVEAPETRLGPIPGGAYEVVRRLPETGSDFQYRVKSVRDGHERVVKEKDLV